MRQIKASEVKPGMTIRWETEMKIKGTTECNGVGGVLIWGDNRTTEYLDSDAKITVVSEPQPEEPTAFGARVVAGGYEFLLSNGGRRSWKARLDGNRYAWADLCGMGPVTVVDANPSWETPTAPNVPERIEEWPEDDTALRPYKWRGRDGYIWKWLAAASEWECYDAVGNGMVSGGRPSYGPWTRETDA